MKTIIKCREDAILVNQMGYESGWFGKKRNPFKKLSMEWYCWRDGWILGVCIKDKNSRFKLNESYDFSQLI